MGQIEVQHMQEGPVLQQSALVSERDHKEQQYVGIAMKDDVPFTDSGYNSAPHLEHSLNVQPVLEESPCPLIVCSSSARSDGGDYDAKTLYSIGTTVNPGHSRNYIIELAKDFYNKLHRSIDVEDVTVFPKILPELVKAFAIKLCHDAPTPVNCRIMHFIHKRHQQVIAQLELMFNQEEDDEPDRTQGHRGDMSVIDKMRMWMSKAEHDHSVYSKEKLFEGVKDDEEDSIDQSELSTYHNIIVDSPAYQWLLTNLSNEFLLQ
ncbi:Pfs domain protein [Rutstroemia sp. NJR-2017a BBW]|nr:Pfs domain protein [Rutstroemia sp. NJR-2017a BBW]